MSGTWLYRYEVKGIQKFILATNKLKEIRGASSLIEDIGSLFSNALAGCGLDDTMFKTLEPPAAGGATIEVGSEHLEKLEEFMAAWPMIVHLHAPGIQVVQAKVEKQKDSVSLYRKLASERSRQSVELPEAGPLVMRAPRTGLPASELGDEPVDKGTVKVALDPGSKRKRDVKEQDLLGERIGQEYRWLENLEELSHSYVGVVHADANDLGMHKIELAKEQGIEALRDFSEKVGDATIEAVRQAVKDVLEAKQRKDGKLPARPIVVGGDDVTFIIRADLAFDFAVKYLKAFREQSRDRGLDLEAAAGVALVHKSHPFHMAYALSEELCSFSKKTLRGRLNGRTPSSISFLRLTTSLSGSYEDEIRNIWLRTSEDVIGGETDREAAKLLTMCPYTLDEVDGFITISRLESLAKLVSKEEGGEDDKVLPAGVIRDIVGLLQADPKRAKKRWQRFGQVAKDKYGDAWKSCATWFKEAGGEPGNGPWVPFKLKDENAITATPWLDVLTLVHVDED
ncbi:MAG: hypothetical protein GXP49_06245 [Deltaproteobacteria bacterium]|nr:hypothetical protein [Deltaproteobacteria bacterium]